MIYQLKLRYIVYIIQERLNSSSKMNEIVYKLNTLPSSFLTNLGFPMQKGIDKKEKLNIIKNANNEYFPKNIYFSQENYISEIKTQEKYDTILCLSTAKWIHLNYGDTGLKIMFYNIYKQLKIDGLLIFEPQCWKSYKKRKDLTKTIKSNFSEIKLKPENFQKYLEQTYGYECIQITNPPSNNKKLFDRPIYIFKKIK